MTKHIVNGLTIEESSLGKSGYYGSSVSASWRKETPFIAAVGYPSDPILRALIKTQMDSTSYHLGSYDDCRKAAYVIAYYLNDKKAVIEERNEGEIDIPFPAELFDLPEYFTLQDAQAFIAASKNVRKGNKKFDHTKADKALDKYANNFQVYKIPHDVTNLVATMKVLYENGMSLSFAAETVAETCKR